jgi:putative dimethyl sulfoxide reductase chaperone
LQNSERLREFYYTLISRLLVSEIDKDTIEAIKSDDGLLELFVYSKEADDYLSGDTQKIVEDLAAHYVDLFLIRLVPYESFFTSEDQMVNSGTENETLIFYKKYGFEVELLKARVVSGDHIGVEFEFLMNLIKSERDALSEGDDEYAKQIRMVQQEFMQKHLLPFAMMFLPALVEASKSPFYKDAAEIALEFLLTDYEELCRYDNCSS